MGLAAMIIMAIFSSPAAASPVYWSLFNIEGESAQTAAYVTYNSLEDMLRDENRVSSSAPDFFGAGTNVIGSGASISILPVPTAVWLFGTALIGLVGFSKRSKNTYTRISHHPSNAAALFRNLPDFHPVRALKIVKPASLDVTTGSNLVSAPGRRPPTAPI
jgi:hypothetical protein